MALIPWSDKPRWYYGSGPIVKELWDAGFRTTLIQSAEYKPKFQEYDWYRKKPVTAKEQQVRLAAVENSKFLTNAPILSTGEEIDNLSMLLAIRLAKRAIETSNTVVVIDLGAPRVLSRLAQEFEHRDGYDLVIAHNFTIGSTRERTEIARDFAEMDIDAMKVLVSVGSPIDIAKKLYYNRFAAAFYQEQVLFETRNGSRVSRRITRVEER